MTNGILDDMEFERELNALGDDPLKVTRFLAWRVFRMEKESKRRNDDHEKRLCRLEGLGKKAIGAAGGIGTIIGSIIIVIIEYFRR